MSDIAYIYRAEILRAVFGPNAIAAKAYDLHRLNAIAARLAESEQAMEILRAKGYGKTGMTLVEVIRSVPNNLRGVLANLFTFKPFRTGPLGKQEVPGAEVHDIWTSK